MNLNIRLYKRHCLNRNTFNALVIQCNESNQNFNFESTALIKTILFTYVKMYRKCTDF